MPLEGKERERWRRERNGHHGPCRDGEWHIGIAAAGCGPLALVACSGEEPRRDLHGQYEQHRRERVALTYSSQVLDGCPWPLRRIREVADESSVATHRRHWLLKPNALRVSNRNGQANASEISSLSSTFGILFFLRYTAALCTNLKSS